MVKVNLLWNRHLKDFTRCVCCGNANRIVIGIGVFMFLVFVIFGVVVGIIIFGVVIFIAFGVVVGIIIFGIIRFFVIVIFVGCLYEKFIFSGF